MLQLATLPLHQMLLLEIEKNSLLVQVCRLYVECEFFLTELHVLAYFTHNVTLPLLGLFFLKPYTPLDYHFE